MKRFWFTVAFVFLLINLNANTIDSLINLLNNRYAENPQKSLSIIGKIYDLTYQTNPMLATEMAARAIYLCDSVLKDQDKAAYWKMKLAKAYLQTGTLDQATRYLSEVRDYYRQHKDFVNFARSLMYLGEIYQRLKVTEIALEDYNKAEEIFKKYRRWDDLGLVRSKKALIFYNQNFQPDEAYRLIFNTLDSFKLSPAVRAELYSVLAYLYKSDEIYDSALFFYSKANELYKQTGDKFKYALTELNTGEVHIRKNNITAALESFNTALKLFNGLNATRQVAVVLNKIGLAYYKQGDYKQATKYFLKSIEKAKAIQASDILQSNYLYLGRINEQQKQLARALHYYKLYIDERNKEFDRITSQGYAEIILMFQNEEKQREIEILKREEALRTQQIKYLLAFVALLLVLFVAILYMMQKLRKAKKLLEEQYKQIKLQKRELETQSRILEKATNDLLRQKEKIEKQNRDISASIKYASRIQKAMLPKPEQFARYFDDFFIYYRPKETVSGDFYWLAEVTSEKPSLFQEEAKRKIILAVADCTGHGVPGAFMAMLGDAYLNQIIKVQRIYKPDRILAELNKNIRQTLHHGDSESTDGMDIGICVIDPKDRTLEFAGAKLDLIYVQNGKMVRVHGDMYSIGGLKQEQDKTFTLKRIDITTQTIFYMYSDGFQDQFGGKYGRKYMAKNFREFLFKIHSLMPMERQKEELEKEFLRWKGKKYNQMDDITVIGVLLKGKIV